MSSYELEVYAIQMGDAYTTSTQEKGRFCKSIAIQMGDVLQHYSKALRSGVNGPVSSELWLVKMMISRFLSEDWYGRSMRDPLRIYDAFLLGNRNFNKHTHTHYP